MVTLRERERERARDQSFPLLLRAGWGSLSFSRGLPGSRCSREPVCPKSRPSSNCARICCSKKKKAFSVRVTAIVEVRPAEPRERQSIRQQRGGGGTSNSEHSIRPTVKLFKKLFHSKEDDVASLRGFIRPPKKCLKLTFIHPDGSWGLKQNTLEMLVNPKKRQGLEASEQQGTFLHSAVNRTAPRDQSCFLLSAVPARNQRPSYRATSTSVFNQSENTERENAKTVGWLV